MKLIEPSRLEEGLQLLGEYLATEAGEPIRLLVVGGAALVATRLIDRATIDLDVFARRGIVDGEILDARPLPAALLKAAAKVASEMRFEENWINTSAALFALPWDDYPEDFLTDYTEKDYGSHLSISFLGRTGQIYLKFHAAIDPDRNRKKADIEDLQQLAPTFEETQKALNWMHDRDLLTPAHHPELKTLLEALGHETLLPAT